MPNLEGKTFDRYELKQLVGKGGMADVYKGYDPWLEQEIAVKVFKYEEEQMPIRFIRVMRSLSNAHLIPIYDFRSSQIGGITWYYIIMPFMHGGTLRDRIGRTPLSLREASVTLHHIANALDYIHSKGVIYRDIKPSNVLLDAKGWCYLADFGIAQINNTDLIQLTPTDELIGTYYYIAPELFEPGGKAGKGSDLYSLGVLLFEMVTGKLPIPVNAQPPAPSSIVSSIPESVDRVILRALEKKPEERHESAAGLADAFRKALAVSATPQQFVGSQTESIDANQEAQTPAVPEFSKSAQFPKTHPTRLLEPEPQQPMILSDIASAPSQPGENTEVSQIPPIPSNRPVPPRTTRSPQRGRWYVIYSVLIALIVLLFVVISFVGVNLYTNYTKDATATAGALAIATVTATAQVQATATAGPLATATGKTPDYSDLLTNSTNSITQMAQWDGLDGKNGCTFKPNGYHVIAGTLSVHSCRETGYQYGDVTISVDVNILYGGSGGLFLRSPGSAYLGYLLEIDSNGRYKFSIFNGRLLRDWTYSSALNTGYNMTNTVAVIIKGDTFALYANGTYITTLLDPTYTYESGYLAFFASAPNSTTEVVYSNLAVYPLS